MWRHATRKSPLRGSEHQPELTWAYASGLSATVCPGPLPAGRGCGPCGSCRSARLVVGAEIVEAGVAVRDQLPCDDEDRAGDGGIRALSLPRWQASRRQRWPVKVSVRPPEATVGPQDALQTSDELVVKQPLCVLSRPVAVNVVVSS